jgi:ABC-type uncharacterized transport system permease subunit
MFFNFAKVVEAILLEFVVLNILYYMIDSRYFGHPINIQLGYYSLNFFLTPRPR